MYFKEAEMEAIKVGVAEYSFFFLKLQFMTVSFFCFIADVKMSLKRQFIV